MPFAPRRVARRTARRTSRRQAYFNAPPEQAYEPEPQYSAPPPAAPAQPDYVSELEQLNQLKQQGIITEEEYQAKKTQILGL